ncbi:hypothetical protein B0H12DRAFT_661993 [Mycena haematopus]|nr:hypothetical protein B0H12DRAFT_661993 [Mycena haematopus]
MTIIAIIGLMLQTSVAIVAALRLVYAVARDGVLPLSGWISKVTVDGQPQNAVTAIFVFTAALLCTILPSRGAFTSPVNACGILTIATYGLSISFLRLTLTPNDFQAPHFRPGRFGKPFHARAAFFNTLGVCRHDLVVLLSR